MFSNVAFASCLVSMHNHDDIIIYDTIPRPICFIYYISSLTFPVTGHFDLDTEL